MARQRLIAQHTSVGDFQRRGGRQRGQPRRWDGVYSTTFFLPPQFDRAAEWLVVSHGGPHDPSLGVFETHSWQEGGRIHHQQIDRSQPTVTRAWSSVVPIPPGTPRGLRESTVYRRDGTVVESHRRDGAPGSERHWGM